MKQIIFLITHNQQVNPIIEIIFYINANKIESVISYFDNCLWNMGIQNNIYFLYDIDVKFLWVYECWLK